MPGIGGTTIRPDRIHQSPDGDDSPRFQRQANQQRPQSGANNRQNATVVVPHLYRTQDLNPHTTNQPTRRGNRITAQRSVRQGRQLCLAPDVSDL
ncbi:hypothetical protein Raf01_80270 [Rugosimonospora africana]|uniref:Uncharacterized protein n=1 Tax=Rugosimonospora africana TaxID=556532 RepID=A0A8J3VV34_9ACTN|nr:hypothetical protein Raf01_80270 [Rugosimonospora africana]